MDFHSPRARPALARRTGTPRRAGAMNQLMLRLEGIADETGDADKNAANKRRAAAGGDEFARLRHELAVNVRAMVGRKGTRFELQGGSMSLRACDFAMKLSREGGESVFFSFAIDGVLDLTPGVDVALSARVSPDQTENAPVTIPKGFEWPWKRGDPGRKPAGDPSE